MKDEELISLGVAAAAGLGAVYLLIEAMPLLLLFGGGCLLKSVKDGDNDNNDKTMD